jgi:hypothetical protein
MGMWDFISIAVVSGCLLEAYRAYTRSKRSNNADAADVKALEEHVTALEKGSPTIWKPVCARWRRLSPTRIINSAKTSNRSNAETREAKCGTYPASTVSSFAFTSSTSIKSIACGFLTR